MLVTTNYSSVVTYHEGSHQYIHMTFCSCGLSRSLGRLKKGVSIAIKPGNMVN